MGGVIESGHPDASDDVLVARAYLSRVAEACCLPLWRAVERDGPVQVAADIRRGAVPDDLAHATAGRARTADGRADLDAARRLGIRLLVPEGSDWPHAAFASLVSAAGSAAHRTGTGADATAPPVALWARGQGMAAALGFRSVAVVGARASTAYGDRIAAELGFDLARREFDIVSGGAFGIDGQAHRGALAADGSTVIVSAGGVDSPYPRAHERLFAEVAERGLILSESPPGSAPARHRFLSRNRLIAALSTGTVVVEAARRSGALNTAMHCRRLQRILMVVPGPVTSAQSAGCHRLLGDHPGEARLVTCTSDVLAHIGSVSESVAAASSDPAPSAIDALDRTARAVLDGMPARAPITVDRLTSTSGLPVRDVLRSLPVLELAGLVRADDAGRYRLVRPAAGATHSSVVGGTSAASGAGTQC